MPGKAAKVVVSERPWGILEEFRRSKTEPRSVSERAAIIVGAFQGRSNPEIAKSVGRERHAVGIWRRRRWQEGWDELPLLECTLHRRNDCLQALERAAPDKPPRVGQVAARGPSRPARIRSGVS